MSSPEVEDFEITDQDLIDEFNPNRRRPRQSKNKAIYGIWADRESDDERHPGFGAGKGKGKKDYTTPVSFISGGVKVGDKVTKEGVCDDQEFNDQKTDSDDEFDRTCFPTSFAEGSTGRGPNSRKSAYQQRRKPDKDDFGDWEKHTRGIGQRLLEKMGHVAGRGLGKNLQGISTPVEAVKRKGKAALGYYGTERTERSMEDYPIKPDSEEEEEEQFRQQLQQWKKVEGDSKKKKPKYIYKTADEVIASGGKRKISGLQSELSKVKVIDMTGRERRVLSGYHALAHKHDKPEEEVISAQPTEKKAFDMPELLHNLDLLVDMAEDEIVQNNKKLQYEQDLIVNLKYEQDKLNKVCEEEEKQISRLKEVFSIVQCCQERTKPDCTDPMTLDEMAHVLYKLREEFYLEYKLYELSSLVVALVCPMMRAEFESWNPLEKPRHGIDTVKHWRAILEDAQSDFMMRCGEMGPYDRLIWEVWTPHVRKTTLEMWQVRNCDGLVEVLEAWKPVLPEWVLNNILEQVVLPKIHNEVESWNPLTDTMPIHAWLHPWLPLMGDRLCPLYAPIRHKLANALTSWHPSDPSAKMILQPWVDVFKAGHMDAFVVKNILPKLVLCMEEFVINPHQQHLDAWKWVMSWLDLVPHPNMVALLENHFFPKWLQVLCTWLASSPNYDEVTKWYMGWKSMFTERLLAEPSIKEQFRKSLDVMNRAVCGNYQPGARENVAYLTHTERRRDYEAQPAPQDKWENESVRAVTSSVSMPSSFKDLIERRAEENNIIFVPIPNKTHEAKQVYRFGKLQMYIDRGVLFLMENQQWLPVSLNTLVAKAM